jgi:two-component system, OmpR family, sensor histidine kinase VicK
MRDFTVEFDVIREIADLSEEGVIIYSIQENKIIYSNANAFAAIGLKKNDAPADIESILDRVIPEDREYLKNKYASVTQHAITLDVEFRLQAPDQQKFLSCTAYVVFDRSFIVVYIRDISQLRQHENFIVEFGARKNTTLDALSHHMSGALSLMRALSAEAVKHIDRTKDQELKTYFDLLNSNTEHCLDVINDLLQVENRTLTNVYVKKTRIDIVGKLNFIYEELRQSFPLRTFRFIQPGAQIFVNTDEVKFLQIINNFASNALKFSTGNDPVILSVTASEKEVIISVSDSGIGIPEELKPFIFDNKTSAGRSGLHGERSTGIGLSISKHLTHLLNGKIWFESTSGKGATFSLSLERI